MNGAIPQRDALMPRQPRGMGAGLVLALIAHALLILALAFGVAWHASEPAGVEAELWSATPQIAAPRATAPEARPVETPAPPPPVVKRTEPAPRPEPPAVAPEPSPPAPDPQIAIERARREEQKRQEARQEQIDREKARRQKQLLDDREEAQRDKQRAELERKKVAEKERIEKERADAAKLAAAREANLKRMMGQAGATGGPTDAGTAARSSGPSAGWAGRVRAAVRPNIRLLDPVAGNPVATVEVRLAPDGTILGQRLLRSSGVPAYDEAVLRALQKTEVLPRDVDGHVPAVIQINFTPNE